MPSNRIGRWAISLLRKLTVAGREGGAKGPFDVELAPGIRARLFPSSNLCEKRAFCGVQNWDKAERAALVQALKKSESDPFVFIDVGANVGLYSLFLWSAGRKFQKATRVIAVEPDPLNRSRLQFNIDANQASIEVESVAIGGESGEGMLGGGYKNRGEVKLAKGESAGCTAVSIETLPDLIDRAEVTRVDAMKVDIEGHDLVALRCLFTSAPQAVWPSLLIVETTGTGQAPVVAEALEHGYRLAKKTRLNAILVR